MTAISLTVCAILAASAVESHAAPHLNTSTTLFTEGAATDFHFDPAPSSIRLALLPDAAPLIGETPAPAKPRFGTADSANWIFNAGGASNFEENGFGRVGGGVSYFIAENVSLDFEGNFMYFWGPGPNAVGGNFNLLVRWHFFYLNPDTRDFSLYLDGGAGILLASEPVPHDGSRFNFTPQFGLGASWEVCDDLRLYTGVRWHHVSNARLYANNPGIDYAMVYAMVSVPF